MANDKISEEWFEKADKLLPADSYPDEFMRVDVLPLVAHALAAEYANGYQERAKQDKERIAQLEEDNAAFRMSVVALKSVLEARKGNIP